MKEYPIHVRDLHISDPFVLADPVSKKYYLYDRYMEDWNFEGGERPNIQEGVFYAIESRDLIHWSRPKLVFRAEKDYWGQYDYWAPECHYWKGKYYIISSFRGEGTYRRCAALEAESPLGPFHPITDGAATPEGWQCLDGTLYVDKKGKPWMVFCHEWTQVQDGQICAVPLSDDLGRAIGDPLVLFRASEAPWRDDRLGYRPQEGMTWISGFITDGCFPYRTKDGSLLMLWSNYSRHGYAVGYARSKSGEIWGPWEQEPIPLYVMDGAHCMLFHTFEGQLMMALHSPNHPHEKKRMLLFEMEEKGDSLHILNECTGNWFSVDKAREPSDYYTHDPATPPVFSRYGSPYSFWMEAEKKKEEEKQREELKKLHTHTQEEKEIK